MEEWFRDNVVLIVGFLCTGAVALWRISQLEKRSDKQSDTAREDRKATDIKLDAQSELARDDRRAIYGKLDQHSRDMADLKGELRGRGVINGRGDRTNYGGS